MSWTKVLKIKASDNIKIRFSDEEGIKAAYIYFQDRDHEDGDRTEELVEGKLIVDLDKNDHLRGIEILL